MRKVKFKKNKPRKIKAKPKPPTVEEQQLFEELVTVVQKLGIILRREKGNFKGGICVVHGEKKFLFLNKKHAMEQQLITLGKAIRQLDEEQVYLSPRAREFVERLPAEPLPEFVLEAMPESL